MRLLLVNKAYHPHIGGVETVVRQIAVGMRGAGHEVAVLCFGDGASKEEIDGVTVYRERPSFNIGSAPLGFSFFRAFRRLCQWADVVNIHSPNPMAEIAFCASLGRKGAVVCTYHGDAQRPRTLIPFYDFLMRAFLRRCDSVVVTSPKIVDSSRVLSTAGEKITVVPIGLRLEAYRNIPTEDLLAARGLIAPLKPESFKVMFAGRLVYYKGVDVLLRTLKGLKERGRDVTCIIVGDGPLKNDLVRYAEENGLAEACLFIPPQRENIYRALLTTADCFVLPSTHRTEAYGIVLLEAMAAELPVISTELGTGTSWVNLDGETGRVVPPFDVEAMIETIEFFLLSPDSAQRISENAKRRMEKIFTEDVMLMAYREVFQGATGNALYE